MWPLNGETRYAEPVRGLLNTRHASIRAGGEAPSEAAQDDPALPSPFWCTFTADFRKGFLYRFALQLALSGHSAHRGRFRSNKSPGIKWFS